MRGMFVRLCWLLLLSAAAPVSAQPLTYLVGGDAACDFATIQPAIDAAASHAGPDTINVATNATYTAQALKIGAHEVTIRGGFANCTQSTPTGRTTISGLGGAADSVIEITGATGGRALSDLVIRDGDETNAGAGGGIDFAGEGLLTLTNVTVAQNRAGYGGGIAFRGTAVVSPARLVLASDVLVQSNIANGSGGGIRLSGRAHLEMTGARTTLLSNSAFGMDPDSGYGGGLQVLAPATAKIGTGFLNFGALAFNDAKFGGGLAVQARLDDERSEVALVTAGSGPVRINDNLASVAGGAIYIDVPDLDERRVAVCLSGYRIDHNQAPEGAAVFMNGLDWVSTSLQLNKGGCERATESLPRCPPGSGCNRIDHNVSAQLNGQPADGAIMEIGKARLDADGVAWTENVGADIVHALDNFQTSVGTELRNCVIGANQLSGQALAISDDNTLIRNCTIAGNTIGLSTVMTITGRLDLQDSIVWQPGKFALGATHGTLTGQGIVTNDPASLVPLIRLVNRDPRFVDPGVADFRLTAASPAVDFSPATTGADVDADDRAHDVDLPVGDDFGPRDLGAYERPNLPPLVLNGQFPTDLRLWSEVLPGISSHDAATGQMAVDWQDPNSTSAFVRVTARQQCVFLPMPGRYRLGGFARTGGSLPPFTVQTAKLHWALRRDGGDACTQGPVSVPEAEGDLAITSGTALVFASTGDEIEIPPSLWTPNSSLTISMVMQSSAATATPRTRMQGWFDNVTLDLDTVAIFADGFE